MQTERIKLTATVAIDGIVRFAGTIVEVDPDVTDNLYLRDKAVPASKAVADAYDKAANAA